MTKKKAIRNFGGTFFGKKAKLGRFSTECKIISEKMSAPGSASALYAHACTVQRHN